MSPVETMTSPVCCTIILVRHGHTELAGRFCGHIDPPLSTDGLAQLADLSDRLSRYSISHVFSSDLKRARETAESIAEPRNLQVHQFISLRELAFGSWEGLNWDQVMARDREYAQRWLDSYPSVAAPGGENFEDFRIRIRGAMEAVSTQVRGGCAVVGTHAGVIRTFLADIAGQGHAAADFSKCDYASCWEVRYEEGKWSLASETQSAFPCQVMAGTT